MSETNRRTVRRAVAFVVVLAGVTAAIVPAGAQKSLPRPGSVQSVPLKTPRIAPLPESQWTAVQRDLFAKYASEGASANQLGTLLHVPELVEAVMPFLRYTTGHSSLSPRHRKLLILRAAWLTQSPSIWSHHATSARAEGLTAEEIRRIAQGPDAQGWSSFEADLLRLADQVYRNSFVNEALWKTLSTRYELINMMDAVLTVAEFTMLSMMFNSFGVQPDEGLVERLPADVPYSVRVPDREPPLGSPRVVPPPGPGLAITRIFIPYPQLEPRTGNFNYVNRRSPLVPRVRELLILRIGWDTQSEYEFAQHVGSVGRAREYGLDPRNIALGTEAAGWDPLEVTLINAADELYQHAMISDATWKKLSARFNPPEMMSIVMTVGTYRIVSTQANAFGVPLDPGSERFPDVSGR